MNAKKALISVVAAFSLLGAAQSETSLLFSKWQGASFGKGVVEKGVKTLSKKDYIVLCESVCGALSQISHQLCGYKEILDDESKRIANLYLKEINKVAKMAKKRFAKRGEKYDEKVLYLALSTTHILKAVLDDEFMIKFQGYKKSDDLFEFGKILDKNKKLDHYDTAFWADIRPISEQEIQSIKEKLAQKGIA